MAYFVNNLIAIDKLLNTMLSGSHAETLSSRAYRMSGKKKRWRVVRSVIDTLLFWDKNHCQASYEASVARKRAYLDKHKGRS
jgi:hypothetical protein